MTEKVSAFVQDHDLLQADDRVLVAISGGRDSTALAHWLHAHGYDIALAHVNYGLRAEASDEDAAFVRQLALEWSVAFHLHTVSSEAFEDGSVQEVARTIRYTFFESLVEEHGYTKIATAHHLDDRIETLFINLLRGTGLHGLSSIPAKRENIVRPLLSVSREEIDTYIKHHSLAYREDATNAKDDYTRNKVRHHLIPMLEELQPNALFRLQTSLDHLAHDSKAMLAMSAMLVDRDNEDYVINLKLLPAEEKHTWLYHCLRPFGFNRAQAADLIQAKQGGAYTESETHTAVLKGNLMVARAKVSHLEPVVIPESGDYPVGSGHLSIEAVPFDANDMPRSNDRIWMDAKSVNFPLTLRHWQAGERFQPLGCDYAVSISDYLTDKKVDRVQKEQTLVLCDRDGEIIWLLGVQLSEKVKVTGSQSILSLQIQSNSGADS